MAHKISWPYHVPQQVAEAGLSSLSEEQSCHLSKGCLSCTSKEIKVKFNDCIFDLLYRISHSIFTIFISQSLLPALCKKQLPFWPQDILWQVLLKALESLLCALLSFLRLQSPALCATQNLLLQDEVG